MDKKLICIPFAYAGDMNTGINIDPKSAFHTYMKNACVALCSTRYYNNSCDVALVTNIAMQDIPNEYYDILVKSDIKIVTIPFDEFRFPKNYVWSLAFYKLCVLKHLTRMDYSAVCYMDTDVYVQGSFDNIWQECKENILLYDINHGLGTKDYQIICDEFSAFMGNKVLCTHYGGEFFAANINQAKLFCAECETVYQKMINSAFVTTKGDEFVLSLAAHSMKSKIKNAGAYVFRFWTGTDFRLVSTCYKFNRMTVLHVPDAKNNGMVTLYNKYIAAGKIPSDEACWAILELSQVPLKRRLKHLAKMVLKRVSIK